MSRSTYTLFIGVFSAALNLIMFIITFLFLAGFAGFMDEQPTENSSEENSTTETTVEADGDFSMIFLFLLGEFIFSFIISMLMVVGVKKENHHYIAPWVYFTLFGLIFQIFVIFSALHGDEEKSEVHVFAVVLSTVIMAALWYPVYKHYKSLKNCKSAIVVESCTNSTPAPCAGPTYIYNAPADYCHANAKYVPVAVPQQPHTVYPTVSEC